MINLTGTLGILSKVSTQDPVLLQTTLLILYYFLDEFLSLHRLLLSDYMRAGICGCIIFGYCDILIYDGW